MASFFRTTNSLPTRTPTSLVRLLNSAVQTAYCKPLMSAWFAFTYCLVFPFLLLLSAIIDLPNWLIVALRFGRVLFPVAARLVGAHAFTQILLAYQESRDMRIEDEKAARHRTWMARLNAHHRTVCSDMERYEKKLRSVAARSKAEADITIWRMTSRVGILSSELRLIAAKTSELERSKAELRSELQAIIVDKDKELVRMTRLANAREARSNGYELLYKSIDLAQVVKERDEYKKAATSFEAELELITLENEDLRGSNEHLLARLRRLQADFDRVSESARPPPAEIAKWVVRRTQDKLSPQERVDEASDGAG